MKHSWFQVSFAIGLSIGVLAHVFGPITGGHFNPAVTIGAIVEGSCSVLKALVFIVAQIIGGEWPFDFHFFLGKPNLHLCL